MLGAEVPVIKYRWHRGRDHRRARRTWSREAPWAAATSPRAGSTSGRAPPRERTPAGDRRPTDPSRPPGQVELREWRRLEQRQDTHPEFASCAEPASASDSSTNRPAPTPPGGVHADTRYSPGDEPTPAVPRWSHAESTRAQAAPTLPGMEECPGATPWSREKLTSSGSESPIGLKLETEPLRGTRPPPHLLQRKSG